MVNDEYFKEPDFPFDEVPFAAGSVSEERCDDPPEDYEEPCEYSCKTVDDFFRLTDELVGTILNLEEEVVRWRQVLIKYLSKDWAEGLRSDIFNNLSRDFDGDPAYDLYVKLKRGEDPQMSKDHIDRLNRLADGTDDTSITYL